MTKDTQAILLKLILAIGDGSIISNNDDYYDLVEGMVTED